MEKFNTNSLPITFYAHTLQFIKNEIDDGKCEILFEAVEKSGIEMLISKKMPKKLPSVAEKSRYFLDLWRSLEKSEGIIAKNISFLSQKAIYLAQVGNVEINITLYMSYYELKRILEKTGKNWFEITIKKPDSVLKNNCLLNITKDEKISVKGNYIINKIRGTSLKDDFPFEIKSVSKETEKTLFMLYLPYIDGEKTGRYISYKERDTYVIDKTDHKNMLRQVDVFYVGAALCCRLINKYGEPICYFDIGYDPYYNTNKKMHTQAQKSYDMILADLKKYPNIDIIISHWHKDHVSIINDNAINFTRNKSSSPYAKFWKNTRIVSPDPHLRNIITTPSYTKTKRCALTYLINVQGAMQKANNGANFLILQDKNRHTGNEHIPWPNIDIFKCNINNIKIKNPNPHYHGIFAIAKLTSGNNVFLSGDCAYDSIEPNPTSSILKRGYNHLVVSHHGGKYTHTTNNPDKFIPSPSINKNQAVYSTDGVKHGHPNPANVRAYKKAGWVNKRMDILAKSGKNILSLK